MNTPTSATPAELLESLHRHFKSGCGFLDGSQLRAHKAFGACPECAARAAKDGLLSLREYAAAGRGAADGHAT